MGILGLSKLLQDVVPHAIKESEIKHYFGRKIAIDASMSLYQFLIAVRSEGAQLTSVDGETTSHLMGTFYRTIRLVENGIKPVYVFDGKPPQMKSGELLKRNERREEAQKQLEKATEAGEVADIDKFNRRLVKVTKQHAEDAKQLLALMGVPYIDAPCEAEAQCAAMVILTEECSSSSSSKRVFICKKAKTTGNVEQCVPRVPSCVMIGSTTDDVKAGKVYATATEDMDALTFGSNILLRHMTFSEARKMPIQEFHLDRVLEGLELTQSQFIDLCILLGCDYTDSIRGIGPKRAIDLIRQHKSLEDILKNIDTKKYPPPENWNYEGARELFVKPEITDPATIDLKWSDPDEEGLVKFLCGDKQFNEDRVRNGAKKLMKARGGATQGRLDSFFKVLPSTTPVKRKAGDDKKATPNKKGKTGKGPGRKPK